MRITLDTNVLISVLIFNSKTLNSLMHHILIDHTLVISTYILEELEMVVHRKFPKKMNVIEEFLNGIPFESSYTPKEMDMNLFAIRDIKDYPVLYSAINDNVDIFITGDKDFFDSINVEKPEIITPKDFLKKYCNE